MQFIVGGRQIGKTIKMIKLAKEHNSLVLTFSKQRAEQIKKQFNYPKVISIYELGTDNKTSENK